MNTEHSEPVLTKESLFFSANSFHLYTDYRVLSVYCRPSQAEKTLDEEDSPRFEISIN